MRIVLVQNRFGQTALGGTSQVVHLIATGLVELGHTVVVISLAKKFSRQKISGYEVIFLPACFVSLEQWPKFLRIFYHLSLFWPWRGQKLAKLLAELKLDLVWTHNLMGFGWSIAKYFSNYKWIHTLHDVQLLHPSGQLPINFIKNSWLQSIYQHFLHFYIKAPFLVISPSRWLLWLHQSVGFFKHSQILPLANPVLMEARSATEKKQYWFWAGQLYEGKGLKWLINLWLKDKTLPPLFVAGSGRLGEWLQNEVKKDSRLKYLGQLSSGEIYQYLAAARGLIFTSQILENWPTINAEALVCGCPVIAPRAGGVAEMIRPGQGVFFENQNEQSLKSALKEAENLRPQPSAFLVSDPSAYVQEVFRSLT